MSHRVHLLRAAERDLHDLRTYLTTQFGKEAWQESYTQIKANLTCLAQFPLSGVIPTALETLQLRQSRENIAGNNRSIYEVRQDDIYIHIIVDCRRDMKTVLSHRILRADV